MSEIKSNKRDISVELIRIISMLMICELHILGRSGFLNQLSDTQPFNVMYNYTWLLKMVCFCGVNCFGLASGYVGVKKHRKFSNIIYLWAVTFFYSALITAVFYFVMPESVDLKYLLKSFMPITSNQYWYFTSYFFMYMFVPILNYVLNSTSKKQLKSFLIPLIIILPIPTIALGTDPFEISWGYSGFWLCALYMLGGYVKLYIPEQFSRKRLTRVFVLSIAVSLIVSVLTDLINRKTGYKPLEGLTASYFSPLFIAASVSLFVLVVKRDGKYSVFMRKLICGIGSLTYGVYLIHTHPLVYDYLLPKVTGVFADCHPLFIALMIPTSAFGLFVVCCGVDEIRQLFFKAIRLRGIIDLFIEWGKGIATKILQK